MAEHRRRREEVAQGEDTRYQPIDTLGSAIENACKRFSRSGDQALIGWVEPTGANLHPCEFRFSALAEFLVATQGHRILAGGQEWQARTESISDSDSSGRDLSESVCKAIDEAGEEYLELPGATSVELIRNVWIDLCCDIDYEALSHRWLEWIGGQTFAASLESKLAHREFCRSRLYERLLSLYVHRVFHLSAQSVNQALFTFEPARLPWILPLCRLSHVPGRYHILSWQPLNERSGDGKWRRAKTKS